MVSLQLSQNYKILGKCGALWGERERVVGASLVLHLAVWQLRMHCMFYMHNGENLKFIQNYASAVWVERPIALSPLR